MSAGNDRKFIDHLQQKEKGGRPMKCPLFRIPFTEKGKADRGKLDECIKEECAWWDKDYETCAMVSLSDELDNVQYFLKSIKDKMPHEEQFRR